MESLEIGFVCFKVRGPGRAEAGYEEVTFCRLMPQRDLACSFLMLRNVIEQALPFGAVR